MALDGLRRTPLYDAHVAAGARFVPFAGYEMPVQYQGVIPEHLAVRTAAGIFDVSHMGRLELRGPGALEFAQATLSNDLDRIGPGKAQYTLLLNEQGCPIDDLIAYRHADDHLLLVVNAARLDDDRAWLEGRLPGAGVTLTDRTRETAMVALQGPLALSLVGLPWGDPFAFTEGVVAGVDALVARTGYTGEPGVELIVAARDAEELWDGLLTAGAEPIGLGARDTLRLEMCYPLYGNDLDEQHTALEAGLGWACALDGKEFVGADALRAQRDAGLTRKLAPFTISGRGIPRPGMAVAGGGEVTSGTMSPSLEIGIGMAYLPADQAVPGSELMIDVRGREVPAVVAEKPLYTKEF